MARQVITRITDDLDGSEAAETVRFALDTVTYEIDLSEANAEKLRAVLAPYVQAGTRVTARIGKAAGMSRASRADNQAIREWAAHNGITIKERGRIPTDVVRQYETEIRAAA